MLPQFRRQSLFGMTYTEAVSKAADNGYRLTIAPVDTGSILINSPHNFNIDEIMVRVELGVVTQVF